MRSFTQWLDEEGFNVKKAWDIEKGEWVRARGIAHPVKLELFSWQRKILDYVLKPDKDGNLPYRTFIFSCPKKSGKALALDTIIPTPNGYTTMGELDVGDTIFDEDGDPTEVVFATNIMLGHECFEVEFANGEVIVADKEHLWKVLDPEHYESIRQTDELMNGWTAAGGYPYRVPVIDGIKVEDEDLIIPPYVLGLWLGDGHSKGPRITVGNEDLNETAELLAEVWDHISLRFPKDRAPIISLGFGHGGNTKLKDSFCGRLRLLGVFGDKHIPVQYLRASREQRLELLCGLMDSDGSIDKRGNCTFCSMNENLAYDMQELLASLGIKTKVRLSAATLNGREVGTRYRLSFRGYQDEPIFKLERKRDRLKSKPDRKLRSKTNSIVDIRPTESVPVRCIQVDSPSNMFLVGRTMIPTHNTTLAAAMMAWWLEDGPTGIEVYSLATSREHAEGRAFSMLKFHLEAKGYEPSKYRFDHPETRSFVQVLSSSYTAAAGGEPSAVFFDELWGLMTENDRRLYAEMTLPPTEPNAMEVVTTYAGFEGESEELYELYDATVNKGERLKKEFPVLPCYESPDGSIFCYWDHEPRAPWQTDEYYEAELVKRRPEDFLRLHRNQWISGSEEFIPIELYDKCTTLEQPLIYQPDSPYRDYPISVGIDVGTKHDATAVVGVYYDYERQKVGLAFHRIWVPEEGETLDLEETVEQYMLEMWGKPELNITAVRYDPHQFVRSMTSLEKHGLPMLEFNQSSHGEMIKASQNLYEIIRYGALEVYPDDELRSHIRFASAENKGRGFRILKDKGAKTHIDAAIAMAMACYDAVKRGGTDTSKPVEVRSQFSDNSGYDQEVVDKEQEDFPWQLQTPQRAPAQTHLGWD